MHTGHYLLLRHELKDALVDGESHGRCPGKGADEAKAAIDLEGEMRRGTEKDRCDEVQNNAEDRSAEENEVQAESLHVALQWVPANSERNSRRRKKRSEVAVRRSPSCFPAGWAKSSLQKQLKKTCGVTR